MYVGLAWTLAYYLRCISSIPKNMKHALSSGSEQKVSLSCLHTKASGGPTSPNETPEKNKETDKRTSETTRETSFNFEFRALTGITADKIPDG